MERLKTILDRFYDEYDFNARIAFDPIELPHKYHNPRDIEVSGFIASCLAYGRVDLFKPVAAKILDRMGGSPYSFIMGFSPARHRRLFGSIKYRFNENADIICLIYLLHRLLLKHSSIENAFLKYWGPDDTDIGNGLSGVTNECISVNTTPVYGRDVRPAGLLQFFPSPENGSACKRANLFLRWMIRDRDIDFGLWKAVPKNRLVIPLDTHIARISRCLGLTNRKAQDWKTAIEITDSLKRLDPEDPLKYDFSLCHHGIAGACKGLKDDSCKSCVFSRHVVKGE